MGEFGRRGLAILLVGFVLNLPWEILQMPFYAGPAAGLGIGARSHGGPAFADAVIVLAIYGVGALLFGGPGWNPGANPRRWAFVLGAGAVVAAGIEWRALYVTGAWSYGEGMPRVPGLEVGVLPLLQMLVLPGATLAAVGTLLKPRGARTRPALAPTRGGPCGTVAARCGALALTVVLAAAGAPLPLGAAGWELPPRLADLPLGHALRGDEARREIRRLHGKRIPFEKALVAHYEGPAGVAMLYVSEARDVVTAQRQVEKMTNLIRNGSGPFTHLRERVEDGATVFSTLGQGQVHYYFRRGARVVWVAAHAMVARRALAEALRHYR